MKFEKVKAKKSKKGYVWRVHLNYVDQCGSKRKYSKSGFETKAAAEKHGRDIEAEINNTGMVQSDVTLSTLYNEWIELNKIRLSDGTLRQYSLSVQHLKPVMQKPIKLLSYGVLQALFNEMDLAKATKTGVKALLSNLFKYAIRSGYIVNNPIPLIEITGKEKKPTEDALELSEIESICTNITTQDPFKTKSCEIFVWIGYYTGLRAKEILALEWSDIDFESDTLEVSKQQTNDMKSVTNVLKTKGSAAIVPMCEPLKAILTEWRRENPHDLIICDRYGKMILFRSMQRTLTNAGKKSNIPFHTHMLRHTFVTNLIRSGADPKTAAQLARHANTSITLNIYTQMNQKDLSEAVRKTYPGPKKVQNEGNILA